MENLSFGEFLKKKREEQGLSLDELANRTKIRKEFLKALEEERLEVLPAPVFVKGFLRLSAREIDTEPEELISRFETLAKEHPSYRFKEEDWLKKEKKLRIPYKTIFIILVIITILSILVYLSIPKNHSEIEIKEIPTIEESPFSANQEEPVAMSPSTASPIPLDISEAKKRKTEIEEISLKFKAKEKTWIQIQIDEKRPYEVLLRPGDTYKIKAKYCFHLKVGNAGGVRLFLNDIPLEPLGKSGEVVSFTILGSALIKEKR